MSSIRLIQQLDDISSRIEDLCLVVLHGLIAALVCAAVVFRYVLDDPLTWSEEMIVLLFGWMIFLGIANAFRARSHIIIDVVVLFTPPWVRRVLGVIAAFSTALTLAVLGYYSTVYMVREGPNLTPMLGISAAWAIAPLAVSMMLSMLHMLRNFLSEGVEGVLWSDITTRD